MALCTPYMCAQVLLVWPELPFCCEFIAVYKAVHQDSVLSVGPHGVAAAGASCRARVMQVQ